MHSPEDDSQGVLRRTVLAGLGAAGVLSTVGTAAATPHGRGTNRGNRPTDTPGSKHERMMSTYRLRTNAARDHCLQGKPPAWNQNEDEARFGTAAMFTKTLPHDDQGIADESAYLALVDALYGHGSLDAVPLAPEADRKLANPAAAGSYDITGPDSHALTMPPAPAFDSDETAAEMVELYWQSLLRDVAFADYATDPGAQAAAAELSALAGYPGPTDGSGTVTTDLLFRGSLAGSEVGPHLSQFFYHDVPRGDGMAQPQVYRVAKEGTDYMTDWESWLAIQRGAAPDSGDQYEATHRTLQTGRDLATYVHRDYVYQSYQDAALILLGLGVPLGPNFPTSPTSGYFVDFGVADVLDAVVAVSHPALHATWVQKWLVNRRLRPETYGGRVHDQLTGDADYGLPAALLDSAALAASFDEYGTYLLSQAYPEGSPTHPSYPAGHAVLAGACVTVLKAYFDEDAAVPYADASPESGPDLTVRGELHKLADNMAVGRNWAGIHYRSDADDGYRLGEAVAFGYLVDRAKTYDERYGFDGFTLTTFDGEPVRITPDGVVPA
ncbi:vanadium-dependent haloperoxidase [Haloarchaeobius sp. HME9146]|uniref:vanadium-dependent haloperoxidase n=1 Tax=Haloarchaeobius sp. HME9146 TaxID=2978732 RepID=UPI0021C0FCDA|nr:vanadium-dependent haloperoxidase [Haloarchaeobius sp. HME9146]MCT9097888.1 vanadium-dependent haloperoxidase [Haloarchaeobius sp. HME9146]